MSKLKRLGVLTGGGDCPGLNPAIKAVTKKALSFGIEVVGIREGWKGLVEQGAEWTMPLCADDVRHIDRQGGTILRTSRTNPFKKPENLKALLANFKRLSLDGLVAIGGEDTLGVANRLFNEHKLPVVGVPKTIDRDLSGTDYTLGFESALQVITDSVDSLRSTAESHSRVFVVEIMGRHAGHLTLRGAISAGASLALIPEHAFEVEKVCHLLKERVKHGIRYGIVFVSEGALPKGGEAVLSGSEKDDFGHVRLGGIADWLATQIQKQAGLECRSLNLSHLQRGGKPVAYDRRMGFYFGTAAVEAAHAGHFGQMASLQKGRVTLVPLSAAVGELRVVNLAQCYDTDHYRAKQSILGATEPIESGE